MKKLFSLFLIGFTVFAFAQGRSISLLKKITEPITISDSIKLSVDDEIKLTLGTNIDGSFKFVQMLNNFNEPIKPADSCKNHEIHNRIIMGQFAGIQAELTYGLTEQVKEEIRNNIENIQF